jgi:hypothetical protein
MTPSQVERAKLLLDSLRSKRKLLHELLCLPEHREFVTIEVSAMTRYKEDVSLRQFVAAIKADILGCEIELVSLGVEIDVGPGA